MGFEAMTREAPARSRSNWPTSEGEGVCERAAGRTEGGGREAVWGCGGVRVGEECDCGFPSLFCFIML